MKKKILILFVLLSSFFFLIAGNNNDNSNNLLEVKEVHAASTSPSIIYLNTGGSTYWEQGGAWFAAYFYGNGDTWRTMSHVGSNLYAVETPTDKSYTNVIFVRMKNTDTSTLDFSNSWNQTPDLTLSSSNNLYKITKWSSGSWSSVSESDSVAPKSNKLYLKPNSTWYSDDARFAAYFTDDTGTYHWWSNMTESSINTTEKIYEVAKPTKSFSKVIFVRLNGDTTDNHWDNKWNQTVDLIVPTNNNMYKLNVTSISSGTDYGKYDGGWSNITLSSITFRFAASSSLAAAPYANACLSFDGEDQNNIWSKILMTKETSTTYRGKSIYKVTIPVLYGCVDILEILNNSGSSLCYAIGDENEKGTTNNTTSYFSTERLYYYGTASGESSFTGWKSKVDTIFNVNDASESTHIVEDCYEDDIIAAPTVTRDDGYTFAGWYDNEELSGVSIGTFLSGKQYWASWGIVFTPGSTIYVIPNQKWLSKGTIAIDLYGAGRNDFYDMEKIVNMDGSIVYSFTIPTQIEGQTPEYTNAIILWVKESVVGYTIDNRWSNVIAQTNDLTQSEDGYLGYEIGAYQNNSGVSPDYDGTDSPKPRFGGEWVEMGCLIINNHNSSEQPLTLIHKVGHSISSFNITAPVNKSFMGFEDDGGNSIELSFPLTITNTPVTYTENWIDANYTHSNFVVYYKECSTVENSYGVQPFYVGLTFYTDEQITYYGSEVENKYYYWLTLKEDGTDKVVGRYETYTDLLADLADFDIKYSCLLNTGAIDDTNFDKQYQLILSIVERTNSNVVLNSTLDSTTVLDELKTLTFSNLIDNYIVEQRLNNNYTFDLINDLEDKAVFQLHEHTFSDSDDVNKKYINDALYLYRYCHVCTHKEKVDDVTVTRTKNSETSYTYTTTIEEQQYSYTSTNGMLTYIYESKSEHYSLDGREEKYAAMTKDGILINEFKSLFAAIEACYDYDEKVKDYNPSGLGSYVVKIINGDYDDRILFRNKTSYIYSEDSLKENTDMYWYYSDGASLQRYGYWEDDYWTSLLATSKYISIQRTADLKATDANNEASLNGHAASYSIFAENSSVENYNASPVYNYCYGLDSAASIFLVPGSTTVRYWFNLKDSQIYPSYNESDKAWAYVGYASATQDWILHQGLKCDTTTGNWYYYVGKVTTTTNGIEIEEMNIPGVTDVCYMTSTFDEVNGYYSPNENINMSISGKSVDDGNGGYNITITLQMVFEDERKIDKSVTLNSKEDIASFRLTMGLDVDTNNDLADYMCGAQFINLVIPYGQAYSSGKGTTRNIHNPYTVSGENSNYLLTDVNRHSTLYNNVVTSKLDGANGISCTNTTTIPDIISSPVYYGEDSTERKVPVYNFSYRSIDNNANPFAYKLQNVMDEVQELYDIETIVQNEIIASNDNEISYTEYTKKYNSVTAIYDTLEDQERTVLQMSYPNDNHGNKYNSFIYESKIDIDRIREFEYRAKGNVYYAGLGMNEVAELGGQLSYNTKTDTHILLVSLPLYGRVELIDDGITLTTANPASDQRVVQISGLFTTKKKADWTQNLYTDGNDYTFFCSKASGSSYQIEYNWRNNNILVKQAPNQTLNYVGPYRYKSSSTGEFYTKFDRLTYTIEIDGSISSLYSGSFDPITNLYTFNATLKDWDAVALYYDGQVITPDNTQVVGLYSTYSTASDKLYWADDGINKLRFMRSGRGNVEFTYRFIYDPINARLTIKEDVVNTISGIDNESYGSGVSYWAPGAILRDAVSGWKKVTKSDGTVASENANGYRMYVVVDAKGRICYMVVYPVNGYGGIDTYSYYAHPLYRDYKNNPAVVSTDNYITWSLKVPEGGFGLTLHQDGTAYENINLLLSYLSNGSITAHGGDPNQIMINTRYSLDNGYRLSISNDHKTVSIAYTLT